MSRRHAHGQERKNYSHISSEEEEEGEEEEEEESFVNNGPVVVRPALEEDENHPTERRITNRTRNSYNRLSDLEESESNVNTTKKEENKKVTKKTRSAAVSESKLEKQDDSCADDITISSEREEDDEETGKNRITVIILDVAQKKFRVVVARDATVATLKSAGSKVHKVPPDRQRLIFRGKMLVNEEDKLDKIGITADHTIVHLFPKPRVVIKDHSAAAAAAAADTNSTTLDHNQPTSSNNNHHHHDDDEEGARVPTIVLDADEAERRSQILVLGSTDYMEAQNNVKLFSFMILIISSIELMNLLALAMGVPQQDSSNSHSIVTIDDDAFERAFNLTTTTTTSSTTNNNTFNSSDFASGLDSNTWTWASTVDLIVSVMGVYVGILGLQAATFNTLRLAKLYLFGTFVTGVGWLLFNFVMTYRIDKEVEEKRETDPNFADDYSFLDDSDLRWQALSVMVLPAMVWFLCCLRAYQFQQLLLEAEMEAQQRIRSEFEAVVERVGDVVVTNHHDQELNLQQHPTAQIS